MKIATHSGNFHTDEIFAVAALLKVYPNAELVRSRESEVWQAADIVVDVGFIYDPQIARYDHHQTGGAGKRPNGIPYASFGLVWKHYGPKLASVDTQEIIDERLCMAIDAIDNGVEIAEYKFKGVREYSLSDYLYSFVDQANTDKEYLNSNFMKLVGIAQEVLSNEISQAETLVRDTNTVREIIKNSADKRVITLPDRLEWERAVADFPEIMFVVYPRKEGNWGVKAVGAGVGFARKKLMPDSWIEKSSDELAAMTGVEDALFMHRGRHLALASTKEGAIKLAEIALNT